MTRKKNPAAVALGSIRSARKSASSRANGKRGGHPFQPETLDLGRRFLGQWLSLRPDSRGPIAWWFALKLGITPERGQRLFDAIDGDAIIARHTTEKESK